MTTTETSPRPRRRGLLARTLVRWHRWILFAWIGGSILTMAFLLVKIRPVYQASCTLRVITDPLDLYNEPKKPDAAEAFLNTQVQLIKSPNVLSAAATNPKAAALERIQKAGDVVTELKKAITVTVIPGTSLIEVSMNSPESSFEAATLVNAVVDSFLSINKEWAEATTKGQIKTLEAYESELKQQVDQVAAEWKRLVNQGNDETQVVVQAPAEGDRPTKKSTITLAMIKEINQKLFDTNIELSEAEALASALEAAAANLAKNPASPPDEARWLAEVDRRLKADLEVAEIAAKLKEARDAREELRAKSPPGDAAVQEASRKVEALLSLHDRILEEKASAFRDEAKAERDRDWRLAEARARVQALSVRRDTLQAQFDKLEVTAKGQSRDEVAIALVLDKRESLKEMMTAVERRLEQLRFESRGDDRITRIDQAKPSSLPVRDDRAKALAIAPLAVLPLSFVLFALVEAMAVPREADPWEEL